MYQASLELLEEDELDRSKSLCKGDRGWANRAARIYRMQLYTKLFCKESYADCSFSSSELLPLFAA